MFKIRLDKSLLLLLLIARSSFVLANNENNIHTANHRQKIQHKISEFNRIAEGYVKSEQYDSVLVYADSAIKLAAINHVPPGSELTKSNYLSALALSYLDEYDKVIGILKPVIDYWEVHPPFDKNLLAISYYRLAFAYSAKENYDQSIICFEKSLAYFIRIGVAEKELEKYYREIGKAFYRQGNFALSEKYLTKALSIALKYKPKTDILIGKYYTDLGAVYTSFEKYPKALDYLFKSIKFYKENGEENNTKSLTIAYLNIGSAYCNWEKYDSAIIFYKKAIDQAPLIWSRYHSIFSKINNNISLCFEGVGKYDSALYYLNRAFEYNDPTFVPVDVNSTIEIDRIRSKAEFIKTLGIYTEVLTLKYFNEYPDEDILKQNIVISLKAVHFMDKLRRSYSDQNSKLLLGDTYGIINKYAIISCNELYSKTKDSRYLSDAFFFVQKSKANILKDLLNDSRAKLFSKIPDSLVVKENTLQSEIEKTDLEFNALVSKSKTINTKEIALLQEKKAKLELESQKLISFFEKKYKSYYTARYDSKVIDIQKLQKSISNNDLIVEYCLADSLYPGLKKSELFIFTISKSSYNLYKVDLNDEFSKNFNVYHSSLTSPKIDLKFNSYQQFTHSSHALYNILVKPYENEIEGKHLIIIPDGLLGYIPFEALLYKSANVNEVDYKTLAYLIRKVPVSYGYSSSFVKQFPAKALNSMKVLAVAPTFNSQKLAMLRGRQNYYLSDIVNAQKEASDVVSIVGGKVLSNDYATKKNYLDNAENFGIIHFATHGLINDTSPLQSKLMFFPSAASDEENSLSAYELYNHQLNAEMVVLSACNTGGGKLYNGEGIISLSRGFMYAGVPSVVMTLWEVDDLSGSILMKSFYTYLSQGKDKDVALRMAKLDYLNNSTQFYKFHPSFWSSYLVIGEKGSLSNKHFALKWMLSCGIIVLLVSLYMYKKRRTISRPSSI